MDGKLEFCWVLLFAPCPGVRYDIALLKLATPASGSASVDLVNLPYPHQMLPHGYTCYITGWGLIQSCTNTDAHTRTHAQIHTQAYADTHGQSQILMLAHARTQSRHM